MRRIYFPVLLGNLDEDRANGFVVLFSVEAACRALMASIVPLQLYGLMEDAQLVSIAYFATSIAGLAVSLVMPMVIHVLTRRWVMTVGAACYIASANLFALGQVWAAVAGLLVQITATATLEVTINLYMMDHIPRRELNRFEPKRMLFSGCAFIVGPWLGVYLHHNVMENATFLVVGLLAVCLLAWFWKLRLSDNPAISAARRAPPNPIRFIPRFASQPRLVLAWILAVGRNGWWLMFFVYTPIFVTSAGYSPELGAGLVSLGTMPMLVVRYWGRLCERFGIRRVLVSAYLGTGLATLSVGVVAGLLPVAAMVLLVASAFLATVIDGAGNVPYLRAVHPYERAEMTSVYGTYRQGTSLATPALFAMVLAIAPLPFVFVTGGVVHCCMSWLSRYLPKKL